MSAMFAITARMRPLLLELESVRRGGEGLRLRTVSYTTLRQSGATSILTD